jgi:hypothetical protein
MPLYDLISWCVLFPASASNRWQHQSERSPWRFRGVGVVLSFDVNEADERTVGPFDPSNLELIDDRRQSAVLGFMPKRPKSSQDGING